MLKTIMLGYGKQIGSHWFKIFKRNIFRQPIAHVEETNAKNKSSLNVELCNS